MMKLHQQAAQANTDILEIGMKFSLKGALYPEPRVQGGPIDESQYDFGYG